ncbi:alcohol dehydrogenase class-3 chain L-like isoform X1 [Parasteatoda tepidariorum]|uniref:alcohol dehydrogenase class-3 chain L-like isoform X1 n=1 Tax=Parasteatoda tepidariorum TaxID=114398 RepID=UPI00077FBB14|nr:alcohol dehydrogenase class-3 chain L-like isoform X1 [Parasteatoda tepidariorum]XP_015920154.1 alcohol dehydrogenase class-3 chain L-like isoform X1 [Parasteatoda tepidariorum]
MATAGKPIICRAAVLWEKSQPYSLENVEVAVPKKGEVRIKIVSSGICHSDVHFQDGMMDNFVFPAVLGHEGAGIIESIGEGVTRCKEGDLVVLAFESYCEECDFCKNPNCNMCMKQPRNNLQMDGTSRITCKGKSLTQMFSISTFSEYTVVSQFNVAKVNPKANLSSLCLVGCCLPTGYGAAINAGKVTPGSSCAIWGLGGVGMCVVMGCRDAGASKIIGIDLNPKKYELAKELGATDFINPKEVPNVPEALAKMTNGGVDFCFVSVGILSVMNEAFKASHPHWGKTVIIGMGDMGAAVKAGVLDLLFGRQLMGTFYGSYKAVRDIPQLVDKIVNGNIQVEKLITHRLTLDKINEGFKMLKSGESLRTVIDFNKKE